MDTEIFTCPIDLNRYDTTNRKPISIIPCGHSICNGCYDAIKRTNNLCPLCRTRMTGFVTNFLALNYLNQPSASANNNPAASSSAVSIKFIIV